MFKRQIRDYYKVTVDGDLFCVFKCYLAVSVMARRGTVG